MVGVDAAQDATGLAGIPAERYARLGARPRRAARPRARCGGPASGIPTAPVRADRAHGHRRLGRRPRVRGAAFWTSPIRWRAWRPAGRAQRAPGRAARPGRELRIVAPGTDLTRRRRRAAPGSSSAADTNLPDGEVFAGPPRTPRGRRHVPVPRARRPGVPTACACGSSAGVVVEAHGRRRARTCSTRARHRRRRAPLGEVGIGTNYAIAAGHRRHAARREDRRHASTSRSARATRRLGGDNVSAIHWDLVCDLRGGGRIDADGEALLLEGRLVI